MIREESGASMEGERRPVKLLLDSCRKFRDWISPKVGGMEPLSSLLLRSTTNSDELSAVQFKKFEGMGPESRFPAMFNCWRDPIRSSTGRGPEKLLFWTSRLSRMDPNWLREGGRGPERLLLAAEN